MQLMKVLYYLTGLLILRLCLGAEPLPPLPKDISLTNGAVLRNISIVRWEKDRVILRHVGGIDPIRLDHIAPSDRAKLEKHRASTQDDEKNSPQSSSQTTEYKGQTFVTTAGAGAYKFSGAEVIAFPQSLRSELIERAHSKRPLTFERMPLTQKKDAIREMFLSAFQELAGSAIVRVKSDADGKWSLKTSQKIVLVSTATRRLSGGVWESYTWIISPSSGEVMLTQDNDFEGF